MKTIFLYSLYYKLFCWERYLYNYWIFLLYYVVEKKFFFILFFFKGKIYIYIFQNFHKSFCIDIRAFSAPNGDEYPSAVGFTWYWYPALHIGYFDIEFVFSDAYWTFDWNCFLRIFLIFALVYTSGTTIFEKT